MKPRRLKNKRMIITLSLLTVCIMLSLNKDTTHFDRFFSTGPTSPRTYGHSLRSLSKYLGNGQCEWLAPEKLDESSTMNTTTLLASYPGSGKRLAWRILEALTGSVTGDDWDLSENGYDVLTLKTSYPHPEGIWSWGNNMDQAILLVRNPRAAIPSYHTMRYEIDYSSSWVESFLKTNDTYTKRPSIDAWNTWRDLNFDAEVKLWGQVIDFWMKNGQLKAPDHGTYQDLHCTYNMVPCEPKAVIQFEKLISSNHELGAVETDKIATVLENSPNVNVMETAGVPCIHEKVLLRKEFYNANRDGNGPDPSLKRFEYWQVLAMKNEAVRIKIDYSESPWDSDPVAQNLVTIMGDYILELEEEFLLEWAEWNSTHVDDGAWVSTTPSASPAFSR